MKHHLFSDSLSGLNFVAIGGGNGLSTLLSGLKRFVHESDTEPVWLDNLSAIVAVTDDGGSSGRLRDELQMLPPGDIRNCMVALSEDSQLLSRLFKHRFRGDGDLGGHIFGNLFLAALSEISGVPLGKCEGAEFREARRGVHHSAHPCKGPQNTRKT